MIFLPVKPGSTDPQDYFFCELCKKEQKVEDMLKDKPCCVECYLQELDNKEQMGKEYDGLIDTILNTK